MKKKLNYINNMHHTARTTMAIHRAIAEAQASGKTTILKSTQGSVIITPENSLLEFNAEKMEAATKIYLED